MTPLLIFSTFPDPETARRIARVLLEERLVACANLLPAVESHYWWRGQLETAAETLALFKTTRETYPAMEARLRALHPYELPEIVAVKPAGGLPDYLRWVGESVTPPPLRSSEP